METGLERLNGGCVKTNKLEAAKYQLADAIRMSFASEFSLVSVHTLGASARQVLSDLCGARGIARDFEELSGVGCLDKLTKKELLNAIRAPQNFLKHADVDPDAAIEYKDQLTHLIIYDACQLYRKLTGSLFREGTVYQGWVLIKYEEEFGGKGFLEHEYPGLSSWPDTSDIKAYAELLNT